MESSDEMEIEDNNNNNDDNYFKTKWSSSLLCNDEVFQTIYNDSGYLDDNGLVLTNDDYEDKHNKFANILQQYYTLYKKTDQYKSDNSSLVSLRELTPVLLQRTEGILSTLLFITLDQNHDFRGGRTAGSESWVTVKNSTFVGKASWVNNKFEYPLNNTYLNTLVNTSFSGLKSIIGLLIINDEFIQNLVSSTDFYNQTEDKLNILSIMQQFNIGYDSIGTDINMRGSSPDGNRIKLNNGSIEMLFLSFANSTWDHGMHDIWTVDSKKHVYLVQLKSLTKTPTRLDPEYDSFKYTVIENIIPTYECFFSSADNDISYLGAILGDANSVAYKQSEITEEKLEEYYNKLLKHFNTTSLNRGAIIKFFGLGNSKKDKKQLFRDLCKYIGKNIDPKISKGYEVPKSFIDNDTENIFELINDCKLNDENQDREIIYKLFGSVNDSNISIDLNSQIFKNLNCPQKIENIPEKEEQIKSRSISIKRPTGFSRQSDTNSNEMSTLTQDYTSPSSSSIFTRTTGETKTTDTDASKKSSKSFIISKSCSKNLNKTQICGQFINTIVESDDPECIEEYYPTKFQLNSGVIDSSGLGGQNMAKYFAPDIDIFMTIFDKNSNLRGAIIKLTFLKNVLTNIIGIKNGADVYCHLMYLDFDDIELNNTELNVQNWKNDYSKYPIALKELLMYSCNNTYYITGSEEDKLTNFITKTKSGDKKWYYFKMSTVGPSVKEINHTVQKIIKKFFDWVLDNNDVLIDSIVRVAQRIYMNDSTLQTILEPNLVDEDYKRNTFFEGIFFLRIKYLGDKSRCTDSLFLNTNEMMEPLQVTLDENAYFTALLNGASTLFSTETKTSLYFSPYLTKENKYIRINPNGLEQKRKIFQAVSTLEPSKATETKKNVSKAESATIFSNLFKSEFNPNSDCINAKGFVKFDGFMNPYNSMKILNGEKEDEGASGSYDVPVNKLDNISNQNALLDSCTNMLAIFKENLDDIGLPKNDYDKIIDTGSYRIGECGTTLIEEPNENQQTKLNEFRNLFKTLEYVGSSGTSSYIDNIQEDYSPNNPKSLPKFENALFECVKNGIGSIINKCDSLKNSYTGLFKQEEIRASYGNISEAFSSLINPDKTIQDNFMKDSQKIKINIVNELIDSLIQSFNELPNILSKNEIKNGLYNNYILEYSTFTIDNLNKIKDQDLPQNIKDIYLNNLKNQIDAMFNDKLMSMSKISNNDKELIKQIWPINSNQNYNGVFEIMNVIRDYNNLFSEISTVIISDRNFREIIENNNVILNDTVQIPNIFNGTFVECIKKLYSIYQSVENYTKCVNNNKQPEFSLKSKPTSAASIPTSIPTSIPASVPTSIPTSVPTSIPMDIVSEEPSKKRTLEQTDIDEGPSRTGRMRLKIGRQTDVTGGAILLDRQNNFDFSPISFKEPEYQVATSTKDIQAPVAQDQAEAITDSNFEVNYKKNKINIVNNFISLIQFYNEKYNSLVNGTTINYAEIKDINILLIAITLASVNEELKYYNLVNIDGLVNEIKNNLNKATDLKAVINVRNYYNSFFNKFIKIDQLEDPENLTSFNCNEENCDIDLLESNNVSYYLKQLLQILKSNVNVLAYNYYYCQKNDIIVSNYNVVLKMFNELDVLMYTYFNKICDYYDLFIYLVIFLIRYCNDLIIYINKSNLHFENGYMNDFNIISDLLNKLERIEYKKVLFNNIQMVSKPSIEYLNDKLSLPGEKSLYFDTKDGLTNASRVYMAIFVEDLREETKETNELDVSNKIGGKNKTKKNRNKYLNKKKSINNKSIHKKYTRKIKKNKRKRNTRRN